MPGAICMCNYQKEVATDIQGQMQGDVYTGTDTVEYLADGVPDKFSLQQMSQY